MQATLSKTLKNPNSSSKSDFLAGAKFSSNAISFEISVLLQKCEEILEDEFENPENKSVKLKSNFDQMENVLKKGIAKKIVQEI